MLQGKCRQKCAALGSKSVEVPAHRSQTRIGTPELALLVVSVIGRNVVMLMIAAHQRNTTFSQKIDHLVRLRSKADEVASDDDFNNSLCGNIRHYRAQRGEVTVNIGEDRHRPSGIRTHLAITRISASVARQSDAARCPPIGIP